MYRILLLPLVAICLETIDVCIWRMFVFMSVVVTLWGSVCCVAAVIKDSVFFSFGVLKYVVCLCKGCDGLDVVFSVCIVGLCSYRELQ